VDLRTVAGRASNSSLACRCHSSMVSRYTIFGCCDCGGCGALFYKICDRTRTGILPANNEGTTSSWTWHAGKVHHAFSLIREEHEVTAAIEHVHQHFRDSFQHLAICASLALTERSYLVFTKSCASDGHFRTLYCLASSNLALGHQICV